MNYQFTSSQLTQLLLSTIELFLEYQDVHGQVKNTAKWSAVNEMVEGLNAEVDLLNTGELTPTQATFTPVQEGKNA